MAGGTFTVQNKVRPGAYINFKAKPQSLMKVSDRGIATLAIPMSWGPEGEIIDLLSSDLVDGTSLTKIGYTSVDKESLLFRLCLQNCYRLKAWRLDSGGQKATATIGSEETSIKPTAKYAGKCGNDIKIVVVKDSEDASTYTVETLYRNVRQDIQANLTAPSELVDNAFVDWNLTGAETFSATAATSLTGGTDGTVTDSTAYPLYFKAMKTEIWNTMGIITSEASVKTTFVEYIKDLRENEGIKVQGCLCDKPDADYEGIISSHQGYKTEIETVTKENFVAWVTGATAGANVNESNTKKIVQDAIEIIDPMTNTEIIEALKAGKFVISKTRSGNITVEKDINTLHNFTAQKSYDFSKNRVIRVLDEMGNTVNSTWEDNYCGKLDNEVDGRNTYKAHLVKYGTTMQEIKAITNFLGAEDIEVLMGDEVDAVVVNWPVQPVDAMEKLYMTFTVGRKDI